MAIVIAILNLLAVVVVVGFGGRAAIRLLHDPEQAHENLVSKRERRATTAAGGPLTFLGASTLVDGPLTVPADPLVLLLRDIVLLVYPDFTPESLG
jgi:hypothetical protein